MTPSSSNELPDRRSLTTLVYERLLDSILSGNRSSGSGIDVPAAAKELGVSPTPVREALVRLEAEGLVETTASGRASVISFTRDDVIATFQVREFLEVGAARLAAEAITEDEVAELRDRAEQCTARYHEGVSKRVVLDLDDQFHLLIALMSRNPLLETQITRFGRRVRVIQWLRLGPSSMRAEETAAEHGAIIDALAAHDAEKAGEAMSRHIRSSLARILAAFDQPKE